MRPHVNIFIENMFHSDPAKSPFLGTVKFTKQTYQQQVDGMLVGSPFDKVREKYAGARPLVLKELTEDEMKTIGSFKVYSYALYAYIMGNIVTDSIIIKLDPERVEKVAGIKNTSLKGAINLLILSNVLARTGDGNRCVNYEYYVNPLFIYKGNLTNLCYRYGLFKHKKPHIIPLDIDNKSSYRDQIALASIAKKMNNKKLKHEFKSI